MPHSRHTEIRREDIMKVPELTLLSESEESGAYMAMARMTGILHHRPFRVFALYAE